MTYDDLLPHSTISLQPWRCAASDFRWLWRKSWCYYSNEHIVHKGWQILIPYADKVVFTPSQHIVHRRWQILIPHVDKVDVITPINILFRGGSEFWSLMKIKLMLLPQSTYCAERVAFSMWWWSWWMMWWCDDDDDGDGDGDDDDDDHDDDHDHDDCKCGATSGLGRTCI